MTCNRRGSSMIEAMVVIVLMAILLTVGVPTYGRAVEQSRADLAAANLRAVWSAQRVYWLEHHTFAPSLADLGTLLDPTITASSGPYTFTIISADAVSFTATATRSGSTKWSGQFTVTQTGTLTGSIQATGESAITPGYQ